MGAGQVWLHCAGLKNLRIKFDSLNTHIMPFWWNLVDTMDLGSISRNTSKGSTPLLPTTTLFNNKKYVIYLYSSIKIHTFVTSKQRDIWNMVY